MIPGVQVACLRKKCRHRVREGFISHRRKAE